MATEIVVQKEVNPLAILQQAVDKGATIEQITALMGLAERWEVNQDKRALREAMAAFKKNPPAIIKDRIAKVQTKAGGTFEYSFADLDAITRESQVALAERGVTHGYTLTESGQTISVTCILKYGMYDEPGATLSGAPDNSGTKNDIQAKASTVSYLQKYTFMAAAGLAAGMPDKDGNGVLPQGVQNLVSDILKAGDLTDLQTVFTAAYKTTKDAKIRKVYSEAKDTRKAQLSEVAA